MGTDWELLKVRLTQRATLEWYWAALADERRAVAAGVFPGWERGAARRVGRTLGQMLLADRGLLHW